MSKKQTVSISRRRAVALSTAIATVMLAGLTSVAAQAEQMQFEAEIVECDVVIVAGNVLDLGDSPEIDPVGKFYEFEEVAAFEVTWQAGGFDCAGSLHAERTSIDKDGMQAVGGAEFHLDGAELGMEGSQQVAAALNSPKSFDVLMRIPFDAGVGRYSTTLTFTHVVE